MPLPKGLKLSRTGDIFERIGLGTWKARPNGEVGTAVKTALTAGYKNIDGAWIYGNEAEIGAVLKEEVGKTITRKDLFYASKLWPIFYAPERVAGAFEQSRSALGLDYLDLYLLHWPFAYQYVNDKVTMPKDKAGNQLFDEGFQVKDTWRELEKLVEAGKIRNIGVCNHGIKKLEELLKVAKIKPSVLQVELHPYNPQPDLLKFCKQENIAVTAYSPLGSGGTPSPLQDPVITELAKKLSLTPAQVLLSWAATRGTVAIPKSVKPDRIKENLHVVELDSADMAKIDAISQRVRYVAPKPWLDGARKMWGHELFD